jgi:hypothetical protein
MEDRASHPWTREEAVRRLLALFAAWSAHREAERKNRQMLRWWVSATRRAGVSHRVRTAQDNRRWKLN